MIDVDVSWDEKDILKESDVIVICCRLFNEYLSAF